MRIRRFQADLRQALRFIALTTMQNTFAGMKPDCSVLIPMTQIITLLSAPSAQPSQRRRPTRIVEVIVSKQDK